MMIMAIGYIYSCSNLWYAAAVVCTLRQDAVLALLLLAERGRACLHVRETRGPAAAARRPALSKPDAGARRGGPVLCIIDIPQMCKRHRLVGNSIRRYNSSVARGRQSVHEISLR